MSFDPNSISPPEEITTEWNKEWYKHRWPVSTTFGNLAEFYTDIARWGATQAAEALRHQWPEPIRNRPPTEEDGDIRGRVQVFDGVWALRHWTNHVDRPLPWLHTPCWSPKPKPTAQGEALALLKRAASSPIFQFSPEEIALLTQVIKSA